jgi:hypothetical protein
MRDISLTRYGKTHIRRRTGGPQLPSFTCYFNIEITQAYATAVGGVFSIYFVVAILPYLMPFIEKISLFASKHLIYL